MHKEPLIRVAKRDGMPLYQNILIRAVAIVLAMLLVVLFVHFTAGISAGTTISYMWEGVFGNSIYLRPIWTTSWCKTMCSIRQSFCVLPWRLPRHLRCVSGTVELKDRFLQEDWQPRS